MNQDKFWKVAFTISWMLLFVFAGLTAFHLVMESNRKPDVNNYIGKSAYQIAVDHGFEGSEDMWLESLKAVPGKNGINGENGKDSKSTNTITVIEKQTIIEKQTEIPVPGPEGQPGKTPNIAQDSETGLIYWQIDGDDEWQLVPKLCLGVLCK